MDVESVGTYDGKCIPTYQLDEAPSGFIVTGGIAVYGLGLHSVSVSVFLVSPCYRCGSEGSYCASLWRCSTVDDQHRLDIFGATTHPVVTRTLSDLSTWHLRK